MKKLIKLLLGILGVLYAIVVVFLTACLIQYNDYKITEFGKYSLIIVDDDSLEPQFDKGSLAVVEKNEFSDVNVGDDIFFYNTYESQINVSVAKVIGTEKITDTETTFVLEGDYSLSSEYFIGKVETTSTYKGVGNVLGVLESRYGFLFLIVLPVLVAFIYEIYAIVKEIKNPSED